MTNEAKKTMMQTLFKVCEHYGLQFDTSLSFKKRNELLEKLKDANEAAWKLVSGYIELELKADRIHNDTEKQTKRRELWLAENTLVTEQRDKAKEALELFCQTNNIPY